MKKRLAPAVLAFALLAVFTAGQKTAYIGSEKCQVCHRAESRGKQYQLWESTKHSKSYAALTSSQAAQAAQALGIDKPETSPKCQGCHAPLFDKAPDRKAESVSCEFCHGPGSEYAKLTVMKDKAAAVQNGLKLYGSMDAIKTFCLTCHENAHGKSFDFAAGWDKIKHPLPAK
jgi:hypothetical protein